MSEQPKTKTESKRPAQVTLKRPHTHRGVDYPVGATLTVKPRQAKWLKSIGVA